MRKSSRRHSCAAGRAALRLCNLGYRRSAALLLPALSLLVTYLFFYDYLPPRRRVHIPFDLPGYHYSLNDYAFQALRHGRLPEWDPTLACGLSFTANVQSATFYPPIWLLYLANFHRPRLAYLTFEIFVFLHVWLAFLLCYGWLAGRKLARMACLLGAGTFAFSGYLMLQLQHIGLVCAYAWIPLGLWAVDESIERATWRPLWKLALASAMAFLAGYPPTWVVFAVCVLAYTVARRPLAWKNALGVACALAASMLLSMVQVLPAWEASALAEHGTHYGSGIRAAKFYLSYLVPNYFDFGLHTPVQTNPGYEYLYLGAPAFLGLAFALRRVAWRASAPLWGMLAVSAIVVVNPFGAVWALIRHSDVLSDLVRSWYFLAGITAVLAPLAAIGFDRFLRKPRGRFSNWAAASILAASAGWAFVEIRKTGGGLPAGWQSLLPALLTFFLFAAAIWLYRASHGAWRVLLGAAMLLLAGADYRVWGTSLRVNADPGDLDRFNRQYGVFRGMSDANFEEIRRHPEYRVISDLNNSFWLEFRHFGIETPQGSDPLIPRQYRRVFGAGAGDTATDIDATRRKDLLQLLGVRYVLSSQNGLRLEALRQDADFRLLPGGDYWQVFEYRDAQLPYRWEGEPGAAIERLEWQPERREFRVRSAGAGRFVQVDQFYPGWEAWVDGRAVPIERWHDAFQSVRVPAGEHRVLFQFHSRWLRPGAAVSLGALLVMILVAFGPSNDLTRPMIEPRGTSLPQSPPVIL